MALNADRFLNLLEARGVLSPADIDSMRKQAAAASAPMHPVFIARRLVQLGYLNPYFAKTLLADCASEDAAADGDYENVELEPLEDSKPKQTPKPKKPVPTPPPPPPPPVQAQPIGFDDLILPQIEQVDFLSDQSVQRAMLIPALRRKKGWTGWLKRSGYRSNGTSPVRQLLLMSGCAALAAGVVGLIVVMATRR